MIKPEIYYTLECDRCRKMFEDSDDHIAYPSSYEIWESAYASEWIEYEGKHYCPNCYHFDDKKQSFLPYDAWPPSLFQLEKFVNTHIGYGGARFVEYEEAFVINIHLRRKEVVHEGHRQMIGLILNGQSWGMREDVAMGAYSNNSIIIRVEKL